MEIRPLGQAYVPAAADLLNVVEPEFVTTSELLLHQLRSPVTRARRQLWVAVEGDNVVGVTSAYLRWWSNELDVGQIGVGVRPGRRRRGIGSQLLKVAEQHLRERDAKRLRVRAERDSVGVAFARAHGYAERVVSEVLWSLDPAAASIDEAPPLEGFELAPLREHRESAGALFDFFVAAGGIAAGAPVTFDDWKSAILENPTLDYDGSFVVARSGQPVALAWLLVDRERAKAENEWTATLPELRGRGLARLAKLATIRWAAANGISEIKTENDVDNAPMLALNRRLGYRELALRDDLERRI